MFSYDKNISSPVQYFFCRYIIATQAKYPEPPAKVKKLWFELKLHVFQVCSALISLLEIPLRLTQFLCQGYPIFQIAALSSRSSFLQNYFLATAEVDFKHWAFKRFDKKPVESQDRKPDENHFKVGARKSAQLGSVVFLPSKFQIFRFLPFFLLKVALHPGLYCCSTNTLLKQHQTSIERQSSRA